VSGATIPGVNTANVGDTQYEITSFRINATGSSGSSASSSTRNFRVQYAGANNANPTNNTMTVADTSTNSNTWPGVGNVTMPEYAWNCTNAGYGQAGRGWVAVDGLGASSWSPSITVVIEARGNRRTMTTYSYTY
jgi:hypothetical protein